MSQINHLYDRIRAVQPIIAVTVRREGGGRYIFTFELTRAGRFKKGRALDFSALRLEATRAPC